jgi:hypothetical protein
MSNNEALKAIGRYYEHEADGRDEEAPTQKKDAVITCTPLMVSQYITTNETSVKKTYKGVCCQVCLFEGRKTRAKSVAICGRHAIQACLVTPNLSAYINDNFKNAVEKSTEEEMAMWRCPDVSDSCWTKAHSFYIERGLWRPSTKAATTTKDHTNLFRHHGVKVLSMLYKNKEDWMLKHGLISKKGGTRGRKSKKQTTTGTTEPTTKQLRTQRRQNKTTTTPATTTRGSNSDYMGSDDDNSEGSLDNDLFNKVTQ